MNKSYILSLDQSTSGSKAMIINKSGEIVEKVSKEHKQLYPSPGWVEHNAVEIYENVKEILSKVISKAGISEEEIAVLAITNQRETVVVWDKHTGEPIYNAIVWQCRRTADICNNLKKRGYENIVKSKTGLVLDPYFSASKVKWILDNVKGAREKAERGELLLGNIDTWLIWNLTDKKVHATDYTNASRTSLFNIKELRWDKELLDIFDISEKMLPQVKSSNDIFGYTNLNGILRNDIPISGVIGDSQGALFGQQCFEVGMAKATYGTGTSILMNTGEKLIESDKGLVTAIAWGIGGKVEYALEGIIHCSGDTIKWVKEELGLFNDFSELEKAVNSLKDNEGVYLIPAFVGLGIPYWEPKAKASIVGMSRSTNKKHILRAAVESIAYQIKEAVESICNESSITLKELRADGGATSNSFLMQFQADMLNRPVVRSKVAELSAMGSVYLAGLGVGFWDSKEELKKLCRDTELYKPTMSEEIREKNCSEWKRYILSVLSSISK